MHGYACKACGAPASVDDAGAIARSCAHTGTVIASMSAVAYGRGGMREASPLLAFFRALGRRLMGAAR